MKLVTCYFIKKKLIRVSKTNQHYDLVVYDDKLKYNLNKQKMYAIPTRLPMIVKPKDYGVDLLRGYLLNDVDFKEELFISKKAYSICSELSYINNVYSMVNNISKTPFKINIPLLNFISHNDSYNMLIDSSVSHDYDNLEKRSKYQESKYKSHNSKVLLQETILEIANFYKNFNEIYLPVRLDQRGRLYCSSSYLNYQSNELSKALLLFAHPGTIYKKDTSSVIYLKAYGANCFGGTIAKASVRSKSDWVDKHQDDILDYDNGRLLNKAADKLLFLSFCIEYKRFVNFITN